MGSDLWYTPVTNDMRQDEFWNRTKTQIPKSLWNEPTRHLSGVLSATQNGLAWAEKLKIKLLENFKKLISLQPLLSGKCEKWHFHHVVFHFSCQVILDVISRTIIPDTMWKLWKVPAQESNIYQDKKHSNKTAQEIFKSVHFPSTVLLTIILRTENTSCSSPDAIFLGLYTTQGWLSK